MGGGRERGRERGWKIDSSCVIQSAVEEKGGEGRGTPSILHFWILIRCGRRLEGREEEEEIEEGGRDEGRSHSVRERERHLQGQGEIRSPPLPSTSLSIQHSDSREKEGRSWKRGKGG